MGVVATMRARAADTLEGLIDSYVEEFGETGTAFICRTASTTLNRWRAVGFRQLDRVERELFIETLTQCREDFRNLFRARDDLYLRRGGKRP